MPGLSDTFIAERNRLRGDALEDLEEERGVPAWLGRQARGFSAGLVDPFGLSGWGLRGVSHLAPNYLFPENARMIQDALSRAGDEAPTAHTMGSTVGPGYGIGRTALTFTAREAAGAIPYMWGMTVPVRNFFDIVTGADDRREETRRAREYGAAGY